MKIYIVGTYGIPNHYGGFEGFVEILGTQLVSKGHEVVVYNPVFHNYPENSYRGVEIKTKPFFRELFRAAAPLVYDYLCLKDALKCKPDIILQCGYSSSFWFKCLKKDPAVKIVTHMDGMEWKRQKWGWITRRFIKWTEKLSVKFSDAIVADHPVIQDYIRSTYGIESSYIPYGADRVAGLEMNTLEDVENEDMGVGQAGVLKEYGLKTRKYSLVIARMEPENNITMMIEGYLHSALEDPLVIVGVTTTRCGQRWVKRFSSGNRIVFTGAIFDQLKLKLLRRHCTFYLHGHSVGGTNPSLLEAMSAGCYILAHDNEFNRGVLGDQGEYFSDRRGLSDMLIRQQLLEERQRVAVPGEYEWGKVVGDYEALFNGILNIG